jgi:serine-type D-Ala-D-Ala carboxypeptidase
VFPVSDIHPHPDFAFELETVMRDAVQAGVVPGLAVLGRREDCKILRTNGLLCTLPDARAVNPSTIYDLASLTKALCTTTLVMQAVAEKRVELDTPAKRYHPEIADGTITVRHLLCHSAGCPAHREYYRDALPSFAAPVTPFARDAIVRHSAREVGVYPPGSKSIYSDIGFILLGAIVEAVFEDALEILFVQRIARPLGLSTLGFRPLQAKTPTDPNIAPTEDCPVRQRLITAEVHDLNAWAMGGVAGHAGLFGTADDVSTVAAALIDSYHGTPSPIALPIELVRHFFAPASVPGSTWGLGWDHPSPGFSLAGTIVSRSAVGHLGFTGVSLWMDPEQSASVVMLSNRVHPRVVDDPRFRALRPAVNDAAFKAVGYPV